jgi:hypothetical protein
MYPGCQSVRYSPLSVVLGTSLNSLHVQYTSATTCMLAIVSTLSWDFCQNISLWLSKELVHLIWYPTELIIIGTNSLVVVQHNLPLINASMEGHHGWSKIFFCVPNYLARKMVVDHYKTMPLWTLNTLPLHRIQSLITLQPGCKQTSWIFTCRSCRRHVWRHHFKNMAVWLWVWLPIA